MTKLINYNNNTHRKSPILCLKKVYFINIMLMNENESQNTLVYDARTHTQKEWHSKFMSLVY